MYDRNARVWLGRSACFPTRRSPRTYDVAALRFRCREAVTNFPEERASAGELAFLQQQPELHAYQGLEPLRAARRAVAGWARLGAPSTWL